MQIEVGQSNRYKLFANLRTSRWLALRSFESATSKSDSLDSITNDIIFKWHAKHSSDL